MQRRACFILLLLCLAGIKLSAQRRLENPEMYIGLSAGANASRVGFVPSVNQDYHLGLNGGLTFRYIGENYVGFQTELNYTLQGWHETDSDFSHTLDYIQLPLITHLYFGRHSRFFANIGPEIAYLIKQESKKIPSGSTSEQHKPIQNHFDYGFLLGIGGAFPIKKHVLQMELRSHFSLGNLYSNNKTDFFSQSNNMKLSLALSYLFRVR